MSLGKQTISRTSWYKIRGLVEKNLKRMKQRFEIIFDFAIAHSDFIIPLKATAELHHSVPYYVVDNFHVAGTGRQKNRTSLIPAQEIKLIQRNSTNVWVHKELDRESMLSIAIGKAIEAVLKDNA